MPLVEPVIAVADVFDALMHERPYKAWTVSEAAAEIRGQAGCQFDSRTVYASSAVQERIKLRCEPTGGPNSRLAKVAPPSAKPDGSMPQSLNRGANGRF